MRNYAPTSSVSGVTVILPVTTETSSLAQTVTTVLRENKADPSQILIVVCDRTKAESMQTVDGIKDQLGSLATVHHQRLPFLGGAMREAFDLARGSHVIMMASDLETDPADVRHLIAEARKRPDAIITASRWRSGHFEGYSRIKLVANWIFQRIFAVLYQTTLSDLTYGYRLFPVALVQSIKWEELRHPFLFETLVKPLRLGVPVIEISTSWKARNEGESQNTFLRNFLYFRIGVKTRFAARKSLLRPNLLTHELSLSERKHGDEKSYRHDNHQPSHHGSRAI